MKNWSIEEEQGVSPCPLKDDCTDAEKVANFLKIPFEIVFNLYSEVIYRWILKRNTG